MEHLLILGPTAAKGRRESAEKKTGGSRTKRPTKPPVFNIINLSNVPEPGCAGRIHLIKQFSGIIESPNYKGNSYPDLSYCQWKIEGLDGDVILISFLAPKCVEMSLVFYQIYL